MIRDDTRAVSVAVTHTLMLGITAVLISGLVLSAGALLQNQEERVAQQRADEVAADVLAHVDTLDRLNESGDTVTTTVDLEYPDAIAGQPYTLVFNDTESGPHDANATLQIEGSGLGRTVYYPIPNDVAVKNSSAQGASPQLSLCDDGKIRFGAC